MNCFFFIKERVIFAKEKSLSNSYLDSNLENLLFNFCFYFIKHINDLFRYHFMPAQCKCHTKERNNCSNDSSNKAVLPSNRFVKPFIKFFHVKYLHKIIGLFSIIVPANFAKKNKSSCSTSLVRISFMYFLYSHCSSVFFYFFIYTPCEGYTNGRNTNYTK